jgi:hypothetical protein
MWSTFTFRRIVIIESLDANEVKTGEILQKFISADAGFIATGSSVELLECGYAGQFLQILQELTLAAASGDVPLLHVECHGSMEEGLEFANGSMLSWGQVSGALLPLNRASGFNILAVFSACFGAHFMGHVAAISPAPVWCAIGPTGKVDPSEIMGGFLTFYSVLFSDEDMSQAVKAISKHQLNQGKWMTLTAEDWFETMVIAYVKGLCTKAIMKTRAKAMFRQLKDEGKYLGMGACTRILQKGNRESLTGQFFDKYFMTDLLPRNVQRFENTRKHMEARLEMLRSTGLYVL